MSSSTHDRQGASSDRSLEGRTVWVTGAGRGIGRALACGLARAGARLAVTSRARSDLESLKDELHGHDVLIMDGSVTDLAQVAQGRALKEGITELDSQLIAAELVFQCQPRIAKLAGHVRQYTQAPASAGSACQLGCGRPVLDDHGLCPGCRTRPAQRHHTEQGSWCRVARQPRARLRRSSRHLPPARPAVRAARSPTGAAGRAGPGRAVGGPGSRDLIPPKRKQDIGVPVIASSAQGMAPEGSWYRARALGECLSRLAEAARSGLNVIRPPSSACSAEILWER